jgi:xylulose-5-phosphate/fructose-6-phosphate phosphoketolase
MAKKVLSADELKKLDAWWRAANYLAAGQLYLLDNPLLRQPLKREHIKRKIVGHWGTVPGQNFIYTHLNRVINKYDLDMIYISGPGHGGNGMIAQDYLDGTYSDIYPNISRDADGMKRLFKQFSFPGGVPSHVAPETPGSINEGGELGYSLAHAFGAVFDNPDLIAACVVGDGEAETGPLATSWHSNKFLNPATDGAVLPILHLNGYKISNPTIFSRISHEEVESFFKGCGWKPYFVEGSDPAAMHEKMAETLDGCIEEIRAIQDAARSGVATERPAWPMIVFRTPKGWTGPKVVDGKNIEGTFRAHQVPIMMDKPEHLAILRKWLKSYRPDELFDENGTLVPELQALAPKGDRRMGANPHANGGKLLRDLRMPDFRDYALDVPAPGAVEAQDMTELGGFVRDIFVLNRDSRNFRIFGPDETMSNRLGKVFEETNRDWNAERFDYDEFLANDGRVMDSMLSEHVCEGYARGISSHRTSRLFQQLRGFHPHRGQYVLPARQVVEGLQPAALAAEHRLAQLRARLQRLAAGSQRLHPSGPRLSGPCRQQEGGRGAPVPAPRCQLSAKLLRPLHPQPQLRERHRRLQAPPAPVAEHGAGRPALHRGHRHLAVGLHRRRQGPGHRHGLLRRHSDA